MTTGMLTQSGSGTTVMAAAATTAVGLLPLRLLPPRLATVIRTFPPVHAPTAAS
jgi:hypothetical protein